MSAEKIPSIDDLLTQAKELYATTFNGESITYASMAPGRVNLIGEHTDYNAGFVFPMALPLATIIVGSKTDGKVSRVKSFSEDGIVEFDVRNIQPGLEPFWANYVKGAIANFHDQDALVNFNAVIISSVPQGGGVSSSAALEVSMYTFLESLTGSKAGSDDKKALACQKAEHEYAEMPCGIMDQFISVMGKQNYAVLIDCKDLTVRKVEISDPSLAILITNSNVKHKLTGSEYPSRRNACFEAAKILGIPSLRELDSNKLQENRDKFDEVTYKRISHVVSEIERTSKAADALEAKNYKLFGELMNASHDSLRDDYEVSCAELDQLVDIARKIDGVYGSRMTGGGFGGCTVTLLTKDSAEIVMKSISEEYKGKPTFYLCQPSNGASILM